MVGILRSDPILIVDSALKGRVLAASRCPSRWVWWPCEQYSVDWKSCPSIEIFWTHLGRIYHPWKCLLASLSSNYGPLSYWRVVARPPLMRSHCPSFPGWDFLSVKPQSPSVCVVVWHVWNCCNAEVQSWDFPVQLGKPHTWKRGESDGWVCHCYNQPSLL